MRSVSGGGLFDFSPATGGSSADYTLYTTLVGAGYAMMSAGMAVFAAYNGSGTAAFLSNFRYPDN